MLANIFLLLVCYSVVKTVREPLILLGGGAEVRSYAAAGQALMLMAFVPLYSAFAARVSRGKLLVGVTLFFIAGLELFTLAVTARVPYVGVAFFIWVGIFNVSLIAQFWSFANDLYTKEAGDAALPDRRHRHDRRRAARLVRRGASVPCRIRAPGHSSDLRGAAGDQRDAVSRHQPPRVATDRRAAPMESAAGGFRLVFRNRYLLLSRCSSCCSTW